MSGIPDGRGVRETATLRRIGYKFRIGTQPKGAPHEEASRRISGFGCRRRGILLFSKRTS
jgi:hypothetical protein